MRTFFFNFYMENYVNSVLTVLCVSGMVDYISNEPKSQNRKRRLRAEMHEVLNQEKSIYLQISEMIEKDILRDIILEEEKVPSTNELAKLYAINPATAAKGINILVDNGVLYKKRGIGMFVATGAKEKIRKKKQEEFADKYLKMLIVEAESIGIGKKELIELIEKNM